MAPRTQVRLPLQVGISCLWSVARSSLLVPGTALALAGLVVGLYLGYLALEGGSGELLYVAVCCVAAPAALVPFAIAHLGHAIASRPSDVVLDAQGLRVEGGPYHGTAFAWSEISPGACRIESARVPRLTVADIFTRLRHNRLRYATSPASGVSAALLRSRRMGPARG